MNRTKFLIFLVISSCIFQTCQEDEEASGTFTDARDSKTYSIVTIRNQRWMGENLAWLPIVTSPTIESYIEKCYYVYGYDGTDIAEAKATDNFGIYGVLYNWQASMGACPEGWHLPSLAEWKVLVDHLGKSDKAGGKLKETGTTHWENPNTGATNSSGFTALPGGFFHANSYFSIGRGGMWWSSYEQFRQEPWSFILGNSYSMYYTNPTICYDGLSVRCVKN